MQQEKQIWLITGASRGIGQAIVKTALATGHSVVATSRSGKITTTSEYEDQFLSLTLDVTKQDKQIYDDVVNATLKHFGRIDVLVNNAGYGQLTCFEETDEEQMQAVFETNVFGLMRVTRAVLPVMRQQKSGHIFNIASSAGYTDKGFSPYNATKFAVTGFSGSLAFELSSTNIKVTNVAPGLFRTDFLDKSSVNNHSSQTISEYDNVRKWLNDFIDSTNHGQPGNPVKLGQLLVEAANSDNAPLHLLVGADAMEAAETYMQDLTKDIAEWRNKSVATAYTQELKKQENL